MHIIDGIGDIKGLVRDDIPTRKGGDKMAEVAGPGRIHLYGLRPRHRVARADLAARGSAEVARQAVGAVRFVRGAALSADRAAELVLPLLRSRTCRCRSSTTRRSGRGIRSSTNMRARSTTTRTSHRAADVKRALAGYSGLVSSMDENIGDVLARCAHAGLEREDACAVHERPRRQRRRARPVGQVDVLRGERRRAADRRRSRRSRGTCGRDAGLAHRLRADDPRGGGRRRWSGQPLPGASLFAVADGARAGPSGALRVSRDRLHGGRVHAALRHASSTATTWRIRRSSSTSRPTPRSSSTSPAIRAHAPILAEGERRCARARSGRSRRAGQGAPAGSARRSSAAARRRLRAATWASRRHPAQQR